MPLTSLQKDVLAVLVGDRTEESDFAGGVVLNAEDSSARFSHDFDIFHELAAEVKQASNRDVASLRSAALSRGHAFARLGVGEGTRLSQGTDQKRRGNGRN